MRDVPRYGGGSDALHPGVFFDRDGTLIEEVDYLADPDEVKLVDGASEAIRSLGEAGYRVVVVTNQSGIARGLYDESDYHAVAERLQSILEDRNATPDGTYYCPHHPDFTGPCPCRKPDTGMHEAAARDLDIDLAGSFYVGDKVTDVLPARRLGGQGILVRTGHGARQESDIPPGVWVVDGAREAAARILALTPGRRRE